MDALKVRQAKSVLDQTINSFFSEAEPSKEKMQHMRMQYDKICDLLEVTDRLLYEGLTAEPE